jgi:glucokinase
VEEMKALALDMGGTHVGCAVVDEDRILAHGEIHVESAPSLNSILKSITRTLNNLMQSAGVRVAECSGIAIGFPGIVDFRTGTIHATLKKYDDARGMNLAGWCDSDFKLRVAIENDARMALLGEAFTGAAIGHTDVTMMTLGTGIGGAALIQGKLLRGKHSQAGCLGGHLPVDFQGRICQCGNIGCAEAEAGGWAIPAIAREWPGFEESRLSALEQFGFREIFSAAEKGDAVALAVRDRCINVWSSNVVANIHAYDPDIVVVGGGVMKSANVIIPRIQQYVTDHAWSGWGKPEVRAASLGNLAGLLGAVPLLREVLNGEKA